MKDASEYLDMGLLHEARKGRPGLSYDSINVVAYGRLLALASGVVFRGSDYCSDEIKRLVELGKDIEATKESEKVGA
jgi:hypothetical protein